MRGQRLRRGCSKKEMRLGKRIIKKTLMENYYRGQDQNIWPSSNGIDLRKQRIDHTNSIRRLVTRQGLLPGHCQTFDFVNHDYQQRRLIFQLFVNFGEQLRDQFAALQN